MRHRMEERNALLVRRVLLLVPQDGPSDGSSISLSLSLRPKRSICCLFISLSLSLFRTNIILPVLVLTWSQHSPLVAYEARDQAMQLIITPSRSVK
jgi:hypothetical protein